MGDRVFFYMNGGGLSSVGTVSSSGLVRSPDWYADEMFGKAWTHVVPVGDQMLLYAFGPNVLGEARMATWDSLRVHPNTTQTLPLDRDWTHIVANRDRLLFYSALNGKGLLNQVGADGLTPVAHWQPGEFLPGWSHVVSGNDRAFFYRAATGEAAVAHLLDNGLRTTCSWDAGAFALDWTHIVASGDWLFFYRQGEGSGVLGRISDDGFESLRPYDAGELSCDWTHLVVNGDRLLFYCANDGRGVLVQLREDGFDPIQEWSPGQLPRYWTLISGDSSSGPMTGWGGMQGFCWPPSAAPGEQITFRTSSYASSFRLTYVRFRNGPSDLSSDGLAAGQDLCAQGVAESPNIPAVSQRTYLPVAEGCASWLPSFTLTVPDGWESGVYAAQCEDQLGSRCWVPFVVKPRPSARKPMAILVNTITWCAYNIWGGYSRYEVPETPVGADWRLSFLRPNPYLLDLSPISAHSMKFGYPYHSMHLVRGELWVLNWLREAGYQFDVYSDVDLHQGIADFERDYRVLILNTHPEYWSTKMYDWLASFLQGGGNLLYLGGNGLYDSVEVDLAAPAITVHGTAGARTRKFRNIGRPEGRLLGVSYLELMPGSRMPYVVDASAVTSGHPFLAGTGLAQGAKMGFRGWSQDGNNNQSGACGWETDDPDQQQRPPGLQVLARGTNPVSPGSMITFRYGGQTTGGRVFSVGSISFGGSLVVDVTLQNILRNVLRELKPLMG